MADDAKEEERYIDLHVRKCSKNQFCIGFKYVLRNGDSDQNPVKYAKFFYGITDTLKREYGNDFVGWDVASETRLIWP